MSLEAIHLVRGGLYVDLGVLFGAPIFATQLAWPRASPLKRGTLALLVVAGLCLSLIGFAMTAAAMAGTSAFEIDPDLFTSIVTGTGAGWAFLVRITALVLILTSIAIPAGPKTPAAKIVAVLGQLRSHHWRGQGMRRRRTALLAWFGFLETFSICWQRRYGLAHW